MLVVAVLFVVCASAVWPRHVLGARLGQRRLANESLCVDCLPGSYSNGSAPTPPWSRLQTIGVETAGEREEEEEGRPRRRLCL